MASKVEKNPWYVDNKQGWLTNRLRVSLFYHFRHSWIILRFYCLLIQLPWNWKAQRIFTMILPNSWIVIAWLKLLIPAFSEWIVPVLWSDLTFHFTRNEGHTSETWRWWNSPSAIGHMAVSGVMFLLHVKVRCSPDWQAGWAGSPFRDLFVCLLVCSTPPPCLLSAYPCVRCELVHRWEGYRERKKEKQRKRARDIEKQGRKGMTNKERVHVKGRKETPPVQTQKKNESKRQAGGRPALRLTSYLTRRVDRRARDSRPPSSILTTDIFSALHAPENDLNLDLSLNCSWLIIHTDLDIQLDPQTPVRTRDLGWRHRGSAWPSVVNSSWKRLWKCQRSNRNKTLLEKGMQAGRWRDGLLGGSEEAVFYFLRCHVT